MDKPAAILRNSVREPVETTTPRPLPASTTVPIDAQPVDSAKAVPAATTSVFLSTGSDSPVSTDSSQLKPVTEIIRMSAGTTSPSRRSIQVSGDQVGDIDHAGFPVAGHDRLVVDLAV